MPDEFDSIQTMLQRSDPIGDTSQQKPGPPRLGERAGSMAMGGLDSMMLGQEERIAGFLAAQGMDWVDPEQNLSKEKRDEAFKRLKDFARQQVRAWFQRMQQQSPHAFQGGQMIGAAMPGNPANLATTLPARGIAAAARAAPKATAAALGATGAAATSTLAGETPAAVVEPTWKTLGISKREWNNMTDPEKDAARIRAEQKREHDKARSFEPDEDTLKRMGLTKSMWQGMDDEARATALRTLAGEKKEAAKSLRLRQPWMNELPRIAALFTGAVPYINRMNQVRKANKFVRQQQRTLAEGQKAVGEGKYFTAEEKANSLENANKLASEAAVTHANPTKVNPLLEPPPHTWLQEFRNMAAPAAIGAEAANYPEQADWVQSLSGTPEQRQQTWDRLVSWDSLFRAGQGAATAAAAREVGGTMMPTINQRKRYPMESTKGFVDTYKPLFQNPEQLQAAIAQGRLPPPYLQGKTAPLGTAIAAPKPKPKGQGRKASRQEREKAVDDLATLHEQSPEQQDATLAAVQRAMASDLAKRVTRPAPKD